ncbi:MAG: hypothetical protein HQL09_05080 [Nitrospirae bacterium]|nr:hypothetical protein [Nitrospirota bacterium]
MAEVTGSNEFQGKEESDSSQENKPPFAEQTGTSLNISQKSVEVQEKPEVFGGPIGLDVGTSNIVMAQNKGAKIGIATQLNAFFAIPQSKFTGQILSQNDIVFFEHNKQYYIIGDSAENFANMFNANTRRPMEKGFLTLREDSGVAIIQAIIKTLVQRPKKLGEIICFTVPGEPLHEDHKFSSLDGHESVIRMYLESLGYTPIAINEGLAVVMAELGDENFTGIGISIGGGMCNICLSYMSVPVIMYSIQKGGDDIDESVSGEVELSATKIKGIKEGGLDLSALPKNNVELALQICYTDLINHVVRSMESVFSSSNKIPKISQPVPIVIGGGAASPKGFREKFENTLRSVRLPFEISSVRVSKDPLYTTAKGALAMAISESK